MNSEVMNPPSRRIEWLVWGGLAIISLTLLLAFVMVQLRSRLASGKPLPVLGQVAEFTLTNQNAQAVSLSDLRGHVWIADIMKLMCCVQKHGIHRSCSSGYPFSTVRDVAKLACPICLFFTLPG